LYPYVRAGSVDVSGGHHDAGDYGKYTINSAAFIHALIFAADAFEGSASLDNLGLPESGDGLSDLLQIAKWEADFLIKMQDSDGGFYFLVQPRDRAYEGNALPERGDPQVVFPKNTSATAAAVAALAQAASSPLIKKAFPRDADHYLKSARAGYRFLSAALSARDADGAYQKITHYGDSFLHDDEIAWARTELYLATGDETIHRDLLASFDPGSAATRRWSWERLPDGYGAAVRSYAFAQKTGRTPLLNRAHLAKCEAEIRAAAADLIAYAAGSAYGTSFPFASKRHRTAGWYFPLSAAFDLAVARALDTNASPEILAAMISNINFEAGSNPNNIVFLTGLGLRRQREVVHQYAANDRRAMPPSGVPIGSIQAGPPYLEPYKRELGEVSFPSDGADNAFPIYDRWGDLWNVKTEHVAAVQARALAALSALMAKTSLKEQPYRSIPASIEVESPGVGLRLAAPGPDLGAARIVWESGEREPSFGPALGFQGSQEQWIEAEAEWPDGRRAFAVWERGSR
ncbi:MAG TPA: glycoside hydrolase family 9 protein, partial [Polyangiaceae bacterium]|nr:glycoside hydrolase family 9 protein [Polyangiaceae bacterium]